MSVEVSRSGTLPKHRIEALADAIFAIVMTLLVLELRIPDLPRHVAQEELLAKLRELAPVFLGFFLTYLFAAAFWLFHHVSFHFVRHTTRALNWINLIFLMFVSLLPFSMGMFGRFPSQPIALVLYWGNLLVMSVMLWVHWTYGRRKGLVDETSDPAGAKRVNQRVVMLPLAYLPAMLIAIVKPEYAAFGFFGAVILFRLWAKQSERAGAR